jgi:hypothetical protein
MQARTRLFTAGAVALASVAVAAPAWGAGRTVCPSGCAFKTIQSAIEASAPGATITVGPGSYFENVKVTKPLTLQGSGAGTVVYPAISEPTCKTGSGSLCSGAASNIILVEASNVTITKLSLNGDNPHLSGGVMVGGAEIDARNGIITNHLNGVPYTNLVVSNVSVSNIYLRGIYASTSGGTFTFERDKVTNVQAEEASIAMFAFEGSGVMADNKVSNANDAISENWSKGTKFLGNKVTSSGSGVHTDNNGGAGGVADEISGNKVSACKPNGYGIFVFATYVPTTVEANIVKGCWIGLDAFGSQPETASVGPTFANNRVSGAGASGSEAGGSVGAYMTTDLVGFGHANVTVTLTHNRIENFATGLLVTQTKPTSGDTVGGQATVSASSNSLAKNGTGADGEPGTVVNAQNNYWGCKQGPGMNAKCDSALGTVGFAPWLSTKP